MTDPGHDRLRTLLEFLESDPSDSFTRFAVAMEYRKQGDLDTALGFLQKIRSEDPAYVGTYYHLGKMLHETGAVEEARGVYEEGIRTAREARDQHALSELQSVLLELDFDD